MSAAVKPAEPPREAPRQLQPKPKWGSDRDSSPSHRGDLQAASDGLHKSDPARSTPNLREPDKIAHPVVAKSSAKLRKILLPAALVLTSGGVYLKRPPALLRQNQRWLFAH